MLAGKIDLNMIVFLDTYQSLVDIKSLILKYWKV